MMGSGWLWILVGGVFLFLMVRGGGCCGGHGGRSGHGGTDPGRKDPSHEGH